ncbi:hypothetical protein CAEBREN_12261 [Caenorhabditis brenneri]|uniref:Uncharacterized protein n=1 Tax=Caenorhabditis brenneri TaxID=135651 RepID=G0MJB9_CAEBE|nr:hypothetical protein CAEBREN_12261 [Caenorhabditis brenneri]
MASTVNTTFLLLTTSAILLFLAPIHANPVGLPKKGCYQKLERWAASYCQQPCAPSFKDYLRVACETQQSQEQIVENCCKDQAPLNKMYF